MSTLSAQSSKTTTRFRGPRRNVQRLATTKRVPGQPPAFLRPPSLHTPPPSRPGASLACPNNACPRPDIIEDDGRQVCATCGVVARESNIVSELQFGETSSGAAAVQGSYVGEGRTHGQSSGGPQPGLTHDGLSSRELTTLSARREIDALINNLRIPANLADPALNIFKLSLAHVIYDSDGSTAEHRKNFVQGRSIRDVAAVALYIACRRQKHTNTIMLIDIAEMMTPQVSVFKIGGIYNRLVRAIWGTADGSVSSSGYIDPINPENLIRRFARDLEFGPLVGKVTEDAIRLVQRMDRDWMTTGRRPAGICGAALILAARMNNFRRTVREVILVVKVCEVTINNRLDEFCHTASSNLTVQQMRQGDQTTPSDPPAFSRAKKEEKQPRKRGRKRKQPAPETAAEIENPDDENEAPQRKKGRIDKDGFAVPEIPIDPMLRNTGPRQSQSDETIAAALTSAVNTAASQIERQEVGHEDEGSTIPQTSEEQSRAKMRPGRPKGSKNRHAPDATDAEVALEAEIEHDILVSMNSEAMQRATPTIATASSTRSTPAFEDSPDTSLELSDPSSVLDSQLGAHIDTSNQPPGPNSNTRIVPQREAVAQVAAARSNPIPICMDPEIHEDEFEDDPEVANALLSESEVRIKEHIWVEENKQWLRDEHVKRIKKQLQDAADIAVGLVPGQSSKKRKRAKQLGDVSYLKDIKQGGPEGDEREGDDDEAARARRAASVAMKGMLERRGFSRRLNYDVLSKIFPDDMANVREQSIGSSRSGRNQRERARPLEGTMSRNSSSTASSPISRSAAPNAILGSSARSPASATSAVAGGTEAQARTSKNSTMSQNQPQTSDSLPRSPEAQPSQPLATLEGEEELVGAISESDSPLSSLQLNMAYNSPAIGTVLGGGFGEAEDEEDDEDEEDEEGQELGPEDYGEEDELEDALRGRCRRPFADDKED